MAQLCATLTAQKMRFLLLALLATTANFASAVSNVTQPCTQDSDCVGNAVCLYSPTKGGLYDPHARCQTDMQDCQCFCLNNHAGKECAFDCSVLSSCRACQAASTMRADVSCQWAYYEDLQSSGGHCGNRASVCCDSKSNICGQDRCPAPLHKDELASACLDGFLPPFTHAFWIVMGTAAVVVSALTWMLVDPLAPGCTRQSDAQPPLLPADVPDDADDLERARLLAGSARSISSLSDGDGEGNAGGSSGGSRQSAASAAAAAARRTQGTTEACCGMCRDHTWDNVASHYLCGVKLMQLTETSSSLSLFSRTFFSWYTPLVMTLLAAVACVVLLFVGGAEAVEWWFPAAILLPGLLIYACFATRKFRTMVDASAGRVLHTETWLLPCFSWQTVLPLADVASIRVVRREKALLSGANLYMLEMARADDGRTFPLLLAGFRSHTLFKAQAKFLALLHYKPPLRSPSALAAAAEAGASSRAKAVPRAAPRTAAARAAADIKTPELPPTPAAPSPLSAEKAGKE